MAILILVMTLAPLASQAFLFALCVASKLPYRAKGIAIAFAGMLMVDRVFQVEPMLRRSITAEAVLDGCMRWSIMPTLISLTGILVLYAVVRETNGTSERGSG